MAASVAGAEVRVASAAPAPPAFLPDARDGALPPLVPGAAFRPGAFAGAFFAARAGAVPAAVLPAFAPVEAAFAPAFPGALTVAFFAAAALRAGVWPPAAVLAGAFRADAFVAGRLPDCLVPLSAVFPAARAAFPGAFAADLPAAPAVLPADFAAFLAGVRVAFFAAGAFLAPDAFFAPGAFLAAGAFVAPGAFFAAGPFFAPGAFLAAGALLAAGPLLAAAAFLAGLCAFFAADFGAPLDSDFDAAFLAAGRGAGLSDPDFLPALLVADLPAAFLAAAGRAEACLAGPPADAFPVVPDVLFTSTLFVAVLARPAWTRSPAAVADIFDCSAVSALDLVLRAMRTSWGAGLALPSCTASARGRVTRKRINRRQEDSLACEATPQNCAAARGG